jgi:hypothetical protein
VIGQAVEEAWGIICAEKANPSQQALSAFLEDSGIDDIKDFSYIVSDDRSLLEELYSHLRKVKRRMVEKILANVA